MAPSAARKLALAALLVGATPWVSALAAPASGDLVPVRPAFRLNAVTTLSVAGSLGGAPCLTPVIQSVKLEPQRASVAARRSLAGLSVDAPLVGERRAIDVDGNIVRFTTDRLSFDRLDVADENGNGRPDLVDAALSGVARAQRLLVGQLDLANPGPVEIVLGRLGSGVESAGFPSSGRTARWQIWVDPGTRGGTGAVRRAVEHQYAHAVAAGAGIDAAWGESFAAWTPLAIEGTPDERLTGAMGRRMAASRAGLVMDDFDLAAGNAAWFAYLQEANGPTAVKLVIEELSRGGSVQAALDRALRRATGSGLDDALREFQVWSLLTGPRDDGRHFSFAGKLPSPEFTSTADSLPVLSVQTDPEIEPMGSAALLLRSSDRAGGVAVRFEGDIQARWAADVIVVRLDGSMHRVAMTLDNEASGDVTVPYQDVRELWMLVRNLDAEGRPARRYTWGAQFISGYPAEITGLRTDTSRDGILISWDSEREHGLLGFNVLRSRGDAAAVRVNPVWIPAVGDSSVAAGYSFLDAGAEAGVPYRYRIEAVTPEGLTSLSDAVAAAPVR